MVPFHVGTGCSTIYLFSSVSNWGGAVWRRHAYPFDLHSNRQHDWRQLTTSDDYDKQLHALA